MRHLPRLNYDDLMSSFLFHVNYPVPLFRPLSSLLLFYVRTYLPYCTILASLVPLARSFSLHLLYGMANFVPRIVSRESIFFRVIHFHLHCEIDGTFTLLCFGRIMHPVDIACYFFFFSFDYCIRCII